MRFAAITDLHFGRASPYCGVDRKLTGHWNANTVHNGISYITIQSLVENTANDGEPAGAWALVEAGATQLDVTVKGRDPARYRVRGLDL